MATITHSIGGRTGSGTASISGNVLSITAVAAGSFDVGQKITGTGIAAGTYITQAPGNGAGSYNVNISQTVASTSISAARDYATPALWRAALPANTVTAGNSYIGEMYNDGEFAVSGASNHILNVVAGSITTGPLNTITFRAAQGHSFKHHPTAASNRVAYDTTKGVALKTSGNGGRPINVDCQYFFIEGFQLKTTDSATQAVYLSGSTCVIKDCIAEATMASGVGTVQIRNGATAQNVVAIQRHATAARAFHVQLSGNLINCTGVRSAQHGAQGIAVGYDSGTGTMRNCLTLGFATHIGLTNSATVSGSNNATSCSSSLIAGDLLNLVYANTVVNGDSTSNTEDYRLKPGSAAINAGIILSGDSNRYDMNGTYRQTADIGAYEIPEAANTMLLFGTTFGNAGVDSEEFTLFLNGFIAEDRVVTLSGSQGDVFTPSSVTIPAGSTAGKFKYKPATAGNKTITVSISGTGISNPAPYAYRADTPATAITWNTPSFIRVGTPSAPFNITVNGGLNQTVNVSLTDDAGGTFTYTSTTLDKYNLTLQAVYTPSSAGAKTVRVINNAGLGIPDNYSATPRPAKVAVPTISDPAKGIRVVTIGTGKDYASIGAFKTYLATQNLVTQNEMLIAEVYNDETISASHTLLLANNNASDATRYCIVRPVPGFDEDTLNPTGPFNLGVEGIQLTISGTLKASVGVEIEGFRVKTIGSGVFGIGGGQNAGPTGFHMAARRCLIEWNSTANVALTEFTVAGEITDNLIVLSTSAALSASAATRVKRNTIARINGATGVAVSLTSSYAGEVVDNAFINCGNAPVSVGSSATVSNNYTNMAMPSPVTGVTVDTVNPLVVDVVNDFTPATGLIGKASASAKSTNDARLNNRGLTPDVGAMQLNYALPLPTGSISNQPAPDGQTLTVPFSTQNSPTTAVATLSPAATPNNTAVLNEGEVVLSNGSGIAYFENIQPGVYVLTITLGHDGGTGSVTGAQSVSIVGISGSPITPENETPPPSLIYKRAMRILNGLVVPLTNAEVGTSIKPVVLVGTRLQLRQTTEGIPVVLENGRLRLLKVEETLEV